MEEATGNMFNQQCNALAISTNGFVKKDGTLVMGKGCAFEATKRHPKLPAKLGEAVKHHGNHVHWALVYLDRLYRNVASFPVKPAGSYWQPGWMMKADPELIKRSAQELSTLADSQLWTEIVLPRPGCGNGGLNWVDVKPILADILDDRFTCMTFDRPYERM